MTRRVNAPNAKRRELLAGIVMTACATAVRSAKGSAPIPAAPMQRSALLARIRSLLAHPHASDAGQRALARLVVFGDALHDARHERWSDERLARTIRANILADHEAGRIVTQSCWQISATEARALKLMRLQSA